MKKTLFYLLARIFGYDSAFVVCQKRKENVLFIETFDKGSFHPMIAKILKRAIKEIKQKENG